MGLFDRNHDTEIANCKIDIERKKSGIENIKRQIEGIKREKQIYVESQSRQLKVITKAEYKKRHREITKQRVDGYNASLARKREEIEALRDWIDRIKQSIERLRHEQKLSR